MPKYIDAEKLNNLLDDVCVTDAIYNAIQELPTADVVEVVRCKDCIYNPLTANEKGFFICQASMMEITDNDYCSYGTRMDSEENEHINKH